LVGSDGLFDNVYEEEILEILSMDVVQNDTQAMAQEIALAASRLAHQQNRMSPFAKGAQLANLYYMGGKVDDITVIVSKVVPNNEEEAKLSKEETSPSSTESHL
jgi:serine/threonine protein phosphatase PrpC